MITQQELKQLLDYNPETGIFTWKVKVRYDLLAGSIAGSYEKQGYRCTTINSKRYKLHRLAWLYVHGYMPDMLDHINEIKDDNRLCNLRPATRSQNTTNIKKRKGEYSSQYKGVSWDKLLKKWRCQVKGSYIGSFTTAEDAAKAYDLKAKEIFGDYAKLNFK